jgi:hypothetical protein
MADEAADVWLKPYEQAGDTEAAMNAYLSWEIDLLDRIKRDGTTNFIAAGKGRSGVGIESDAISAEPSPRRQP